MINKIKELESNVTDMKRFGSNLDLETLRLEEKGF